jgi:hypothetical protein
VSVDYLSDSLEFGSQQEEHHPGALQTQTQTNPIIKEVTQAPADSDGATELTVKKMCEYIAKAASSPICQRAAQEAMRYAQGKPEMIPWGVFFCARHRVKFSRDEGRLFQSGDPEALDLLVAPDVLLSSSNPTEDCDGFTMLACCLLQILGVPAYIVTVATDPGDHERWSHVFAIADLNGQRIPIDASHGKFPGWMVPQAHIFRWQAWDLAGNKVDVPMPARNTLHSYVRAPGSPLPLARLRHKRPLVRRPRGIGQNGDGSGDIFDFSGTGSMLGDSNLSLTDLSNLPLSSTPLPDFLPSLTSGSPAAPNSYVNLFPSTDTTTSPPSSSASSSSANWGSIVNSLVSGALKGAQIATLPAGYTINPATGQLVYTGQAQANAMLTGSLASILPWLALGGVGIVAFMLISNMGKR